MRQIFKTIEDKTACLLSKFVSNSSEDEEDNVFAILGYHRVFPKIEQISSRLQPTWNVTPDMLEAQIGGLLESGFVPVSLEHAIHAANQGEPLQPNSFCVTFDDGYANNFLLAAPILKRLEVPATVFLATKYIGTSEPFPFDEWELSGSEKVPRESWEPVSIETCRNAVEEGIMSLGGHTHCHEDFRHKLVEFRSDLEESASFLQEHFGIEHPPFAFPFGVSKLGFATDEMIGVVKSLDYCCGLNFDNRITLHSDPFRWNRIRVEAFDTEASIRTKVKAGYSRVRDWIDNGTSFVRPSRWIKTKTEFAS